MKKKITIIFLLPISLFLHSQSSKQPMPILGNAVEMHEPEYYHTQIGLWHEQILANPKNAFAWYNYYYATRNWMRTNYKNDKRPHAEKLKIYHQIIDSMKIFVPESFEYNLVEWMQSGNNPEKEKNLLKAYQLGPDRPELVIHIMTYAEIVRDMKLRDQYAKIWLDSDYSSSGLISYAYNLINGLEKNSILFTEGDNDTYPIWLLQSIGIRRDIQVINLNLIQIDNYREKLFKELKIIHASDSLKGKARFTLQAAQIYIQHIYSHINGRKIYVHVGIMPEILDSVKNDLYLTGLTYMISPTSINTQAYIRKNIEQVYKLDYIETNFKRDISRFHINCLNQNYIVSMLSLYKEYLVTNEIDKAERMKKYILLLSQYSEEKGSILKQIDIK